MEKHDKAVVHRRGAPALKGFNDVFEDFRRDIENMMSMPFSSWSLPMSGYGRLERELVRTPLCDMVDRGDKYELHVEVPGIDKEKVNVHATGSGVEISGEQSEKTSDKSKNYVYNERSYNSFYRKIDTPEEIVPSKINAKMVNGILNIELPKKTPTQAKKSTRVEIK